MANETTEDDGTPAEPKDLAAVLSLPGGEVDILPVSAGPDGLPSAVGVTDGVIRVPTGLLDGLAVGAVVVDTLGVEPTPHIVQSVEELSAADALTRAGTVLVAPSDTESWHVVVLGAGACGSAESACETANSRMISVPATPGSGGPARRWRSRWRRGPARAR